MMKYIVLGTIGMLVVGLWASPSSADPPKLLAEFTVAAGGEPIVLPVILKGKTYQFLLDTGANRTTFDTKHEKLLGEPKQSYEAKTPEGESHVMSIYYAPDATVGPLNLQDAGPVFCVDLSILREATGLQIDGVLGNTFLRKYAVQIDFDAGKVRFYQPNGPRSEWGTATDMEMLPSGVPVIFITLVGDVRAIVILDTGFSGSGMIPALLFDDLRKKKKLPAVEAKHLRRGGEDAKTLTMRVDDVRLETLRYPNLLLDRSEEAASLLGLDFLSRHVVTFDFPDGKFCLKKGERFDASDEADMSGLHMLSQEGKVIVHSIDEGSPAAKAGLKPDDILRKIDDQNVQEFTLTTLRKRLRAGDGKTVEVIFQRGDKGFKTTIQLQKKI
ncbi:MAG: aspartyl protease family protein [Phycisphaerae bacterium]|nr:aspartyl protease family protein [Phycisphaerae bacterium]